MAKTTVKIKGKDWTVKLLTPKMFDKEAAKYGAYNAAAFTTLDGSRTILFQKGSMTPGTIRHEILHSIIYEAPVKSADLSAMQVEEMICEIMDSDYLEYISVVEQILVAFC